MDFVDLKGWLDASRTLLDLYKSVRDALPKGGPQRQEVEDKIRTAEEFLKRSDAQLAKQLGYRLCRCTFPPQIMLWKEAERADICLSCGRRMQQPEPGEKRWIY